MKKTTFLTFFILCAIFSSQRISANSSVEECLKELDTVTDDWENWGIIKKKCYQLAENNFQIDKSYENLWFFTKAAKSYAYEDKRGLKPFYKEFYGKYFSSFNSEGLEKGDLEYLFQSYQKLAFFLPIEELVNRSEKLFYQVKNLRPTTPEEEENLLNALILMGSWEKVERFQKESSKQLLSPMTISNLMSLKNQQSGPKFYELEENGEISVKNYNPPKEYSVIIVTSPTCGFSNWAISEIEADKELSDFFKDYGIYISSHMSFLEFGEMVKWNLDHKSTPFKIVYNEEEWPTEVDWDGTPTFVFFKGNKYSHSIG